MASRGVYLSAVATRTCHPLSDPLLLLYRFNPVRTTRQSATAVSSPMDMPAFTGHRQPIAAQLWGRDGGVRHRFWYAAIEPGYPGGYERTTRSRDIVVTVRPDKNERQRLRNGTCAAGRQSLQHYKRG